MNKRQYYVEGYADCINDLETMLPSNTSNISITQLLNLYIIATYLIKLNLQDLQNELNTLNTQETNIIIIKGGK